MPKLIHLDDNYALRATLLKGHLDRRAVIQLLLDRGVDVRAANIYTLNGFIQAAGRIFRD